MTKMNVLISGGSGLIGKALTKKLISLDYNVSVLTRNTDPIDLPDEVHQIVWDAKTLSGWEKSIETNEAIIHLAGESIAGNGLFGLFPQRWSSYRKDLILKSRIETGQILTRAIESSKNKPKVFLQTSAIGYYGPSEHQEITESNKAGKDFLAQVCESWESSSALIGVGMRRIVARIGLPLSTKGGFLPRLMFPYKMFIGGQVGNGQQYYSWIHMDDLVEAFIHFIEDETTSGIYNITAPNPATNMEFGKTISKCINRPHWMPVPSIAFRALFGEVADVVLNGQKVIPEKLLVDEFRFKFPVLNDALQDTLTHRK